MGINVKTGLAICLGMVIALLLIVTVNVSVAQTAYTFDGHVYYIDGVTPVSGATVFIYYPSTSGGIGVLTDSNGYYTWSSSEAYDSVRRSAIINSVSSTEATDTVTGPGTWTRDITMPYNAAGVSFPGQVTLNGAPLANGMVDINYGGSMYDASVSGGNYGLGLWFYGGPVTLTAKHRASSSDPWIYSDPVTFTPGPGYNTPINFAFTTATPTPVPSVILLGKVYYDNGVDPIAGARIYVKYPETGAMVDAVTDSIGFYTFTLPYNGGRLESWVVHDASVSAHYRITPIANEVITRDWILDNVLTPTPAPGATPTPTPAPGATPTPTPAPSSTVTPAQSEGGTATSTPRPGNPTPMNSTAAGNATSTPSPSPVPTMMASPVATPTPAAAGTPGATQKTPFPGAIVTALAVIGSCALLYRLKK